MPILIVRVAVDEPKVKLGEAVAEKAERLNVGEGPESVAETSSEKVFPVGDRLHEPVSLIDMDRIERLGVIRLRVADRDRLDVTSSEKLIDMDRVGEPVRERENVFDSVNSDVNVGGNVTVGVIVIVGDSEALRLNELVRVKDPEMLTVWVPKENVEEALVSVWVVDSDREPFVAVAVMSSVTLAEPVARDKL